MIDDSDEDIPPSGISPGIPPGIPVGMSSDIPPLDASPLRSPLAQRKSESLLQKSMSRLTLKIRSKREGDQNNKENNSPSENSSPDGSPVMKRKIIPSSSSPQPSSSGGTVRRMKRSKQKSDSQLLESFRGGEGSKREQLGMVEGGRTLSSIKKIPEPFVNTSVECGMLLLSV